jgi:DeoR family transcriptional regulator, copper-sensing transcriptional repressor
MANLTDRQQQLHTWLQIQHIITIEEIKGRFGISPASAYRDVHALVDAGLAIKTMRSMKLVEPIETGAPEAAHCSYCGGAINPRAAFIIQMQDGSQRIACCPHCGLMALNSPGIAAALTNDFLYGRKVNARQAFFLLESSVSLCCEPSVLCFACEDEAVNFQRGFGGIICDLETARARIDQMMAIE